MELLEDRTLLSTFTVTDTQDEGSTSLRQAILDANASPGPDVIAFNIAGSGVQTIRPLFGLPAVTDPVTIDGTTQPGYAGVPLIELSGVDAGVAQNGLRITAGGSTVKGLIINRFIGSGILLRTSGGNTISGNYIGTNAAGTAAAANLTGITIESTSPNNVIGGTAAGARNLISGNSNDGVNITGNGNRVEGNYIGSNLAGSAAVTNGGDGVRVVGMNNLIGGTTAAARNLISGSQAVNVRFSGTSSQNQVQGNYLGTDITGQLSLGGEYGVLIEYDARDNLIGGTAAGAGNLISGHRSYGIFLSGPLNRIQGNLIGTDATGTLALPNVGGIEISGTVNTIGGTVPGARNLISGNNYIGIVVSLTGGGAQVQGNYIGTDITGTRALGNEQTGILARGGSIIGGTTAGARNLISGNRQHGVEIDSSSTTMLQGNFIGTDVTGTQVIPNLRRGVSLTSNNNRVGGAVAGAGNLISGNTMEGIVSFGGNVIQGNRIGTDVTGTQALGNGSHGIWVIGQSSTIGPHPTLGGDTPEASNVISGNGGSGIAIFPNTGGRGGNNVIRGNYIGVDITGAAVLPNAGHGIWLLHAGDIIESTPIIYWPNIIGGTIPVARNVISANGGSGIFLDPGNTTTGIEVLGNHVGANAAGTAALGNQQGGIVLRGGRNTIGIPGAGNLISGNVGDGIQIAGTACCTMIRGNRIGIREDGSGPLGNTGHGITWGLPGMSNNSSNTVGGIDPGTDNVIAHNGSDGIRILNGGRDRILGNSLFLNQGNGITLLRNVTDGGTLISFRTNTFHSNGGLAIDLGGDGVTPNDPGDVDTGPNDRQNYPILTSASSAGGITIVSGTLDSSAPNYPFLIEFFASSTADPSGHGEGTTYLGSIEVSNVFSGTTVSFTATLPGEFSAGYVITATAGKDRGLETSEFSPALPVDNSLVQFSFPEYTVIENAGTATVTVVRQGVPSGTVTVGYSTTGITATAGSDFTPVAGTLTFAPGQTSATFTVPILNDDIFEGDETIRLTLSNPSFGHLGLVRTAVLTLVENELSLPRVNVLAPTPTGFNAWFSVAVTVNVLNLYDTAAGALGPADVTLTGSTTGPVRGSLVVDTGDRRTTFVATSGTLPPDTYTVRLRSATDGFRALSSGLLLDGDGDGSAGGDYVTTFTVGLPGNAVIVSVPNITRGPGQAVQVTPTGVGIPLRLSTSGNIFTIRLTLRYNPALLHILTATVAPGVPFGATVTLDTSAQGIAIVNFSTGLGGYSEFVHLTAVVPPTAASYYGGKHVLDFTDIQINGGAIPALDDDGLHVNAYFGDATGNARYSATDATRALRVAVGLDSGFSAYQLADPVIVADITGNGQLNATDATRLLQESIGLDRPEIPPLPTNPPTIAVSGPDPLLSIPRRYRGRSGGLVTVPVNLDPSDGLDSANLALAYDPQQLEVVRVQRGRLTRDFDLFAVNHDAEAGTLRVGLGRSAGAIMNRGKGSVLFIIFRIKPDAPAGRAVINLRQDLDGMATLLNDGGLDLNPDPSNEAGDVLDGIVTVARRRQRMARS